MSSSSTLAPDHPAVERNATLHAPLLALASIIDTGGGRAAVARTHAALQLSAQGGTRAELEPSVWKFSLAPGECVVNGTSRRAAVTPLLVSRILFALGARGGHAGTTNELTALATNGAPLWRWAPPAEPGENASCPLLLAGEAGGDSVYIATVPSDAASASAASTASLWRLGAASGALAWNAPLCSAAACVPLALVPWPGGGAASLSLLDASRLVASRFAANGSRLWEEELPVQRPRALALTLDADAADADADADADGAAAAGGGGGGGGGGDSMLAASPSLLVAAPPPLAGGAAGGGAERLVVVSSARRSAGANSSRQSLWSLSGASGAVEAQHGLGSMFGGAARLQGCLPPLGTPTAMLALVCGTRPTGARLLLFTWDERGRLLPPPHPARFGPPAALLLPQTPVIDAAGTVIALMLAEGGGRGPRGGAAGDEAPVDPRPARPPPAANATLLCSLRLPAGQRGGAIPSPLGNVSAPRPSFPPLPLPASLARPADPRGASVALTADGAILVGGGALLVSVGEADACSGMVCDPQHGVCVVGSGGRPQCFCDANYVGAGGGSLPCSVPYAPGSYSVPLWISYGVAAALLVLVFASVIAVYRSLLWLRLRVKLAPVYESLMYRTTLERHAGREPPAGVPPAPQGGERSAPACASTAYAPPDAGSFAECEGPR